MLKSFWLRDPSQGRNFKFTVLCTAMADRKLISCIGYSLRLATKQGRVSIAQHLWHGFYALTQEQNENECVSIARPLCLYSALGLDGHEPDEKHLPGTTSFRDPAPSTLLDQDLAAGQYASAMVRPFSDQATQTETQMLTMHKSLMASFKRSRKTCAPLSASPFQPWLR